MKSARFGSRLSGWHRARSVQYVLTYSTYTDVTRTTQDVKLKSKTLHGRCILTTLVDLIATAGPSLKDSENFSNHQQQKQQAGDR